VLDGERFQRRLLDDAQILGLLDEGAGIEFSKLGQFRSLLSCNWRSDLG
jgi:hypothetical protein